MNAIDATALSNARLATEVSTAVAVKTKNIAEQQGEAVLSLLQAAADVQRQASIPGPSHLGRTIDVQG